MCDVNRIDEVNGSINTQPIKINAQFKTQGYNKNVYYPWDILMKEKFQMSRELVVQPFPLRRSRRFNALNENGLVKVNLWIVYIYK